MCHTCSLPPQCDAMWHTCSLPPQCDAWKCEAAPSNVPRPLHLPNATPCHLLVLWYSPLMPLAPPLMLLATCWCPVLMPKGLLPFICRWIQASFRLHAIHCLARLDCHVMLHHWPVWSIGSVWSDLSEWGLILIEHLGRLSIAILFERLGLLCSCPWCRS